jgi:hypothetical protein
MQSKLTTILVGWSRPTNNIPCCFPLHKILQPLNMAGALVTRRWNASSKARVVQVLNGRCHPETHEVWDPSGSTVTTVVLPSFNITTYIL